VLGVGIALNAAIFAMVDAYLLRPLPYPDADRLVRVHPSTSAVGWTNSEDVFEKAVSWNADAFTLVGDGVPEVVLGMRVSPDFFDVYGVRPALGRAFRPEEGGEGGAQVAVISHALWTSRFGADPGVLGRVLRAYPADDRDGLESFTIVGVLPRDFWYLNGYTHVLAPLREAGPVYVGRLRPDVPPDRARALLAERAHRAGDVRPGEEELRLPPLQDAYTASIRPQLLALQGAALLVLLAAGASAGLLLLVRASGRTREMSVRRALGAGGGRLAAHLFGEAAILCTGAGVVGVGLGWGALRAIGAVIETRLGRGVPGGTEALRLDGSVILAVVAVGALAAFVLGAVSVVMGARRDLHSGAGGGGWGGAETVGAGRARSALVATQVALSVMLLGGGALLVRSALHLEGMELGFDPDLLDAYTVGLTSERADDPARRSAFFEELLRRTEALPGVASAGLARATPFTGGLVTRVVEVEGRAASGVLPEVVPQIASPGWFRVLALEGTAGRLFGADDGPGGAPVAVVSASLAAAIAGGGTPPAGPVGTRMRFTAWTMPDMSEEPGPWLTVVGVVPDLADGIAGPRPTLYVPYAQAPSAWMDLVVRRRAGFPSLADDVRGIVRDLDENTPLYAEADLPGAVSRARAPSRFFASLLGAFASFSLALALVGLYGVAAYAARQRRRDLAVRIAFGATRRSVEGLFVRNAGVSVALGLLAGFVGARALGGLLGAQLHGVTATDPATLLSVVLAVAATALLAVWIPARGAARLEVSRILRDE
jgi:predicted permease